MHVLKTWLTLWLLLMAWVPGAASALTQEQVALQAKTLYQKYVADAEISLEAQRRLHQEMGPSLSLVVVRKPAWRGMSNTVVICSTKMSKEKGCAPRGDRTSPWLPPLEYVQGIWPAERVVLDRISYLVSNETLYLFYSFAQPSAAAGHPQDPLLSAEDIPWHRIEDPAQRTLKTASTDSQATQASERAAPSNPEATTRVAPGPPPSYRNVYDPGTALHDYPGNYYTLQLGIFDKRTDARRYIRSYGLENTFIVQSRDQEKTLYQLYFGVFPQEEDVYAALEDLPRVVIRRKPQLFTLAIVKAEADRYERWRVSTLETLREMQTKQEKP